MSKNNTPYFDMSLQVESGDLKRVVCFGKKRYETGFANVSIFEELTNKVVNAKSYSFTNLNVGRLKRERGLKTTDVSKIVEFKDLEVDVENYDTKLNIAEFEGKFTSVDLPSLEVQ